MRLVKIKDLGDIVTGNTPSKKIDEFYESNDIPFVKPDGMVEDKILSLRAANEFIAKVAEKKARILGPGSILVTCIGTIGKIGIIECDRMAFNQQINAIVPDVSIVNTKYLAYLIMYNKKRLQAIANAAVVPIINKTQFGEFEVYIHENIEIQSKIASILERAQELIDKRKEQIKACDELIKSQFIEMFGEPISNPRGWKKKKLGNECNIITGNTPSRKVPEYYGDYIEWIKSDNINTPFATLTTATECLSEQGLQVGRSVEAGSILMTCIAGSIKCIGNVGIADRQVSFNQQINAIVPKKHNTWFMYEMFKLSQPYIQSTINMSLKGILSKGQLSELEFIFPPIQLQNQFASFVQQVDKLKFEMQQSLKELENNFNALMQKAFKGELFS